MTLTSDDLGTVFISYSWDSDDHVTAVRALSDRLRSDGIDCILDQYEVSPPEGWPRWMDRNIETADLVLVVCTETYLNRVMGREEVGAGNGVRWEGGLIYQHLYNAGSDNRKFIPVVLRSGDIPHIPVPLQGASRFLVNTDAGYERLYARLLGIPPAQKPRLGTRKPLPRRAVKTDVASYLRTPLDMPLWDRAEWRGTGYATPPGTIPMLAIIFQQQKPAEDIFRAWRERYGESDTFDELRISIVEGEIANEDPGYTVTVGLDFENVVRRYRDAGLEPTVAGPLTGLVRLCRMNPHPKSPHLASFKRAVEERGEYLLHPAILTPDGMSLLRLTELGIRKKQIYFRHSKDITLGDADSVVLDTGSRQRGYTAYGEQLRRSPK